MLRRITGRSVGGCSPTRWPAPSASTPTSGSRPTLEPRVEPLAGGIGLRRTSTRRCAALLEQFMGPDSMLGQGPHVQRRPRPTGRVQRAGLRAAELPAANGVSDARSLSRLYAASIGDVEADERFPGRAEGPRARRRSRPRPPRLTSGNDLVLFFETTFGLDAGKTTLTEKFLLYGGAVQEAGAVKARGERRAARRTGWRWSRSGASRSPRRCCSSPTATTSSTCSTRPATATSPRTPTGCSPPPTPPSWSSTRPRASSRRPSSCSRSAAAGPAAAHVRQQVGPARPRPARAARRDRGADRPASHAGHLAGRHRPATSRRRRPAHRRLHPLHPHRPRRGRGRRGGPRRRRREEHGGDGDAALRRGLDLLDAVGADLDVEASSAGEATPVFVGSALTNFGVPAAARRVVDLAPPPSPASTSTAPPPLDDPFSAFVFKVQANMDPSHRDRIAFVRVCSGRFERGMVVTHGPPASPSPRSTPTRCSARSARPSRRPSRRRRRPRQRHRRPGRRHALRRPARRVPRHPQLRPRALRHGPGARHRPFKQFRKGIAQLDEEGVVQVLRDPGRPPPGGGGGGARSTRPEGGGGGRPPTPAPAGGGSGGGGGRGGAVGGSRGRGGGRGGGGGAGRPGGGAGAPGLGGGENPLARRSAVRTPPRTAWPGRWWSTPPGSAGRRAR